MSWPDIVYVELSFRIVNIKLISDFILDDNNNNNNISSEMSYENIKPIASNVPISIRSLGSSLPVTLDDKNNIKSIDLLLDGKIINFFDRISEKSKLKNIKKDDGLLPLNSSWKFYYIIDRFNFILGIHIMNNKIHKIKFALNGVVQENFYDNLDTNGDIIRTSGNNTMLVRDGEVVSTSINLRCKPIKPQKLNTSYIANPNIGVIDTETYFDSAGKSHIYSIGFKTNLSPKSYTYYIDIDSMSSSDIVISMFEELLRPKYNDITFYCHNFGGYDAYYIIPLLYNYNENNPNNQYKLDFVFRDKKVIRLIIGKDITIYDNMKKEKKTIHRKITILDSYSILNASLIDLCINFGTDVVKSTFPYTFAKEDTLFYIGNTPSIEHYKDMSIVNYNKIKSNSWSFKDESIKYLKLDLDSLYEVITKANKQIFNDYNVNMQDSITISGLAVKVFMQSYYKNKRGTRFLLLINLVFIEI